MLFGASEMIGLSCAVPLTWRAPAEWLEPFGVAQRRNWQRGHRTAAGTAGRAPGCSYWSGASSFCSLVPPRAHSTVPQKTTTGPSPGTEFFRKAAASLALRQGSVKTKKKKERERLETQQYNKYLLRTYYMPGTILGACDTSMTKPTTKNAN